MKKMFFLSMLFFVLVGATVFGQDMYVLDDFPKISDNTIMNVIKKAQKENHIKDINFIYPGQIITFRYPDSGKSFFHTVAKGDQACIIVRNYLTIPNYAEYLHPKRIQQVYNMNLKNIRTK